MPVSKTAVVYWSGADQGEGPTGVFGGYSVDQHVRLWCDDGRVDETEKEETANERADGRVCRVWVLSLRCEARLALAVKRGKDADIPSSSS